MMKRYPQRVLWILLFAVLTSTTGVKAQYTLDEMGVNLALGAGFLHRVEVGNGTANSRDIGPAAQATFFYSHYFCGKRYGIQVQGGASWSQPWVTGALSNFSLNSQLLSFRAGGFFKVRPHDYHRGKEWAFQAGPVFDVPLLAQSRATLDGVTLVESYREIATVRPVTPGLHASFQFRRPLGEHSLFIEPGAEFFLSRSFFTSVQDYRQYQIFLSIGTTFFDKRG